MKARAHFDAKGQALAAAGAGHYAVVVLNRRLPDWAAVAVTHGYLSQHYGIIDTAANGPGWRKRWRETGVKRVQVMADGAHVPSGGVA